MVVISVVAMVVVVRQRESWRVCLPLYVTPQVCLLIGSLF